MKSLSVSKTLCRRLARVRRLSVARIVSDLTRLGDHLEANGNPQWFVVAQAAASIERIRLQGRLSECNSSLLEHDRSMLKVVS